MLIWQKLESSNKQIDVDRVKVPGGWLVFIRRFEAGGVTFYPDPNHQWDGRSLN